MYRVILRKKVYAYCVFTLLASCIALLISLRFTSYMPLPSNTITWIYLCTAFIGHISLLAIIIALVALPFVFIPYNTVRRSCIAIIFSISCCILIADTVVFSLYRFHINTVVLDLFLIGNVAPIPFSSWCIGSIFFCILFISSYALLAYIEYKEYSKQRIVYVFFAYSIIFLCLLIANSLHAWATAFAHQPITVITRYLPLYMPLKANSLMVKLGIINREELAKQKTLIIQDTGILAYPLYPIRTIPVEKPINIVWIVIDSWRYDTFNKDISPNMWKFAQKGYTFTNHYSTGNATRAGIFGLFYGIPSTYWHAFLASHQAPLFITRMQELKYDIGIFSSASTTMPEFHHTVFASITNLSEGAIGNTKVERDRIITNDWLEWFQHRNKNQAFFSYIFYDSVHGGGFVPEDYPQLFTNVAKDINYITLNNNSDATPISNRYKTGVHFVDSLVAKILKQLEESGVLNNTLVIITSDHGEEMNDNKKGYWGHNGNFTAAQTQVPLAIIAPQLSGENPWNATHFKTSHEDITPSLLEKYLGITSPITDYSTGINIFKKPQNRDFLIISSYNMYGVVSDTNIIEVSRIGTYEVLGLDNAPTPLVKPNFTMLQKALNQISRFYQ